MMYTEALYEDHIEDDNKDQDGGKNQYKDQDRNDNQEKARNEDQDEKDLKQHVGLTQVTLT